MHSTPPANGEPIAARDTVEPAFYDIKQLSTLGLGSTRHIRRLADAGRMPSPVRLGTLLKWRVATGDPMTGIRDWIAAGCPDCRPKRRPSR